MRILFIGDIVGSGGREAVNHFVPELRKEYNCAFCVANGENMANGNGFARSTLDELKKSQVDVFTGGDHTWDQKDFEKEILDFPNVLRPANVSAQQPGRGYGIFEAADGTKIGVVNLLGRTFMRFACDCPFAAAERIVEEIHAVTPFIIVDFHAEATSDKISLGRFLDGKVTAVLGTHTHVPTADETVFPGGTAFQCDVGMVGSRDSVLGREIEPIIQHYLSGMPFRFPVTNKNVRLCGSVITVDAEGHATAIERVVRDL
ncbi:MAG: YmdB family metallophosphoesterase [Victivallales bacterium]|nr:YmdB family metallophosphoesterase [Victivallales bacterium]